MSDPFAGLFGGLFSDAPASTPSSLQGTHYEDGKGKHFILLWKMTGFHGAFVGVEVEGPDDKSVHGKPLCFVNHAEIRAESFKAEKAVLRGKAQSEFVRKVEAFYHEKGETIEVAQGFLRSKQRVSPWSRLQPELRKHLEKGPECPSPECRGWARSSLFGFGRIFESVPEHDRFVDDGFCVEHRKLVEAYLAENPDEWPPKEEG